MDQSQPAHPAPCPDRCSPRPPRTHCRRWPCKFGTHPRSRWRVSTPGSRRRGLGESWHSRLAIHRISPPCPTHRAAGRFASRWLVSVLQDTAQTSRRRTRLSPGIHPHRKELFPNARDGLLVSVHQHRTITQREVLAVEDCEGTAGLVLDGDVLTRERKELLWHDKDELLTLWRAEAPGWRCLKALEELCCFRQLAATRSHD